MKIKLLLVDNHRLFLEGLRLILSRSNDFEIVNTFSNPTKALKAVRRDEPELLITDIPMRPMNGLELIRKAKKISPKLKTLIISNYSNRIQSNHIDGYLHKSFEADQLKDVIKKIVLEDQKCFHDVNECQEYPLQLTEGILTKRESQIVQLISQEKLVPHIADLLMISKHTVESHKKNIYRKLHVHSISGLIKIAMYLGVVHE